MTALWDDVDSYVETYERARAQGPLDDLAAFAPPADHRLFLPTLRELVRVDLEFGWAEGQPRKLREYLQRYPALFTDAAAVRDIAFEEFRLRCAAGEKPDIAEYRQFGADDDWRSMVAADKAVGTTSAPPPSSHRLRPFGVMPTSRFGATEELQTQLHSRLRFVALGSAAVLGYFCVLVLLNPLQKVAFSLQNWYLIVFNWISFLLATVLATALWARPIIPLWWLRLIELVLFGMVLSKISLDFFSDLFFDRELQEQFTQGDHALFHYGSSWSLPFFILIVSYGTLIPSTWRRCVRIVAVMAVVPVTIALAGAIWDGMLTRSYVQSFLLQMAIWMVAASAIAVFGTRRIEALQKEVLEARRLGQYQLKERLGAGGMGEVYRAEHVLLRRPCAIKLIRPELAGDGAALRRFEREVKVTATLTHPNTVQIYDYGHTADGTFYYVMEYLPGRNLDEVVRQDGPMPAPRVVHILRQLCGALREAHAVGLVHRDLKPSNIILGKRGGVDDVAKLLDFGLALDHEANRRDQRLSADGTIAGSPLYMSPEQAAGQQTLDRRADIYSLGAVAFFLLTGKPPIVRDTVLQTLAAKIYESVGFAECEKSHIPPHLCKIILRCLEKDPAKRFPDVESLQSDLEARDLAPPTA